MISRRASRLLVLDEARRILLFHYRDDRGAWWATPGGGLEGSESFEDAAIRESGEELGLSDVSLAYQWERTSEFESRGQSIRQVERYFLVRGVGEAGASDAGVREAHALEGILATRWWSRIELRETAERVFPEDLADRLDAMIAAEG